MDRITELEGIGYFFDHAEESGVITSEESIFCAIHTELEWDECKDSILDKIRYREMIEDFKYIRTTKMKNGLNNHVFIVVY